MIEISKSRRRILVTTIFNFHVITENLILIGLEERWCREFYIPRKRTGNWKRLRGVSKKRVIKGGVTQRIYIRTIFVPNRYTNDISESSELISFILFAYDTNLFMSNKNLIKGARRAISLIRKYIRQSLI